MKTQLFGFDRRRGELYKTVDAGNAFSFEEIAGMFNLVYTKSDYRKQQAALAVAFPSLSLFWFDQRNACHGKDAEPVACMAVAEAMGLLWFARHVASSDSKAEAAFSQGNAGDGTCYRGRRSFSFNEISETETAATFRACVRAPYAAWLAEALATADETPGVHARIVREGEYADVPPKRESFACRDTFVLEIEADTGNAVPPADETEADLAVRMVVAKLVSLHLHGSRIVMPDCGGELLQVFDSPLSALWFTAFTASDGLHTGTCITCGNPWVSNHGTRLRCNPCRSWSKQPRNEGRTRAIY